MYYVFSVVDWEDYKPYWFECSCSKEEFHKIVSQVTNDIIEKIMKKDLASYKIYGEDIIGMVVPELEKFGIKHIKIDYEISIRNWLDYKDDTESKIISEENLKKIKKYNDKKYKELCQEMKEKKTL